MKLWFHIWFARKFIYKTEQRKNMPSKSHSQYPAVQTVIHKRSQNIVPLSPSWSNLLEVSTISHKALSSIPSFVFRFIKTNISTANMNWTVVLVLVAVILKTTAVSSSSNSRSNISINCSSSSSSSSINSNS